jgi:hypothetical protein
VALAREALFLRGRDDLPVLVSQSKIYRLCVTIS